MKYHACYWCFFICFGDMSDILYVHYYALISFCDSTLVLGLHNRGSKGGERAVP